MKCNNCGKNLPDDALFCNTCGVELSKPEAKYNVLNEETFNTKTIENISLVEEIESKSNTATINDRVDETAIIKSKKKDRSFIWVGLVICVIFIGIKLYNLHLEKQINEHAMRYVLKDDGDSKRGYENFLSEEEYEENKFTQEFEREAEVLNYECPVEYSNGIVLLKCYVEGKTMVNVLQWDGLEPEDFTSEDIAEIKSGFTQLAKEDRENLYDFMCKMDKYKYNFKHIYINENKEELFFYYINPYEILNQ